MMRIDFYHSLSCLQWTPWHQEKVTTWEFTLCFWANSLFYNYDQFSSSLMVIYHLGLYCFCKQYHQDFVSVLWSTQDVQDLSWQEKDFPKKLYFLLFSIIELLCVCFIHIFMNMQWFDGVCCGRKCIVFYHDVICIQLINQINSQYHIVWNQL